MATQFTGIIASFLLIVLSASMAHAAVAEVLGPIQANVGDGGAIYLGKIGPGQTIYITVKGTTTTGGKFGVGGTWQILRVLETPAGWESSPSKEMAAQMQATVKAAPDAPDGRYRVQLRLEEDVTKQQQLGSVTFYATIDVDKGVLGTAFLQKNIETGVGQPARYEIVVENKGKASDVFEIKSMGLPAWAFEKAIHVPAEKSVRTFYEFTANEEGTYEPVITIASKSSSLITAEQKVKLTIRSNVAGDIKATRNGVLLFPAVLEPLYALLGLIGYVI